MRRRSVLAVLSCLLSALTAAILAGGRPSAASAARRPVIGLSLDTLTAERWQRDRDLFVARAAELGADVLVQTANSDDARQIENVQALISRKVDALVIVPHDGRAMAKGVRLAHEAGIPVISYDRLITDSDPDLYVSFDNVAVGRAQARFLLQRAAGRAPLRIVRVNGAKTDHNAFLYRQGQDEALAPALASGRARIVHDDWAQDWEPANAKKIVNAALTRLGSGVDAVLAANDGTAGGAVQALLEDGLAGKVLVTGQDAELAACQRIARGTQTMTVYKPLKSLAGRAAELAVALAKGRPVAAPRSVFNGKVDVPSVLMDVVVVTRDDLRRTVIKDGYQSESDVFGASRP